MNYRSKLVFDFRPNFSGEVAHGVLDDHSYDAPNGGVAVPWKITSGPKRTLALPFLLDDFADMKAMRGFFSGRDGRRRGFWIPTWLTDYVPVQDEAAGSLTITVKNIGLGTKLAFGVQFRHVALITWGKMEFYRIDGQAIDGNGNEELTLDRVLDTALDASATVCCGAIFARLADDEVSYAYLAGNVAKIDLKFVELPKETEGTEVLGTKPAFLYIISQGSNVWRFTNFPTPIIIDGVTYNASAIEHDDITEDIEFAGDTFSLNVATDDDAHPIRNFLDQSFIQESTLDIYKVDVEALPAALPATTYKGRIESAGFGDKGSIVVNCSTLLRMTEIEVPQAMTERTCVHRTYDGFCALNAALFTTTDNITTFNSLNPPYIEAAAFATQPDDYFSLGLVTIAGQQRFCTKHTGTRLYLNAPFRNIAIGNSASALAGDDRRIDTCLAKFNNVANFLGFPYMPNKNPQFEQLTAPKPAGGKK